MKALLNGDRFEHFTDKELDDMEKVFRDNNMNSLLEEIKSEKLSREEAADYNELDGKE